MRWAVCVVQEKMSSTAGDSASRLNQFKHKGKDANVGEVFLLLIIILLKVMRELGLRELREKKGLRELTVLRKMRELKSNEKAEGDERWLKAKKELRLSLVPKVLIELRKS